jgi:hypothetical protein
VGGYFWYNAQRKRKAAEAAARRRAAQNRQRQQQSRAPYQAPVKPADRENPRPNAPGVRTGSYTEKNGTAGVRPTPDAPQARTAKPYGNKIENPYARYSTKTDEDKTYTASYRPERDRDGNEGKETPRRSPRSTRFHDGGEEQ